MVFPKKTMTVILVVIIVGLTVFFIMVNRASMRKESLPEESSEQVRRAEESPLPVRVVAAERRDLVIRLKSPGEAVTDRKVIIKAEVSGIIKKLNVEEGKHVKGGEFLIELDDREYRLKLEKQEALRLRYLSELYLEKQFADPPRELNPGALEKINRAKEELDRASDLYNKGLISRENYDKAKRDYELVLIETGEKREEIMAAAKGLTQAEIDVRIAQMELDKTKIRAPFAGIITNILVSPQENVERGKDLFTLVDISRIRVQAKILESEVGKMKVGRDVQLKFSAYPQKIFRGKILTIGPVINPADKTCTVHIAVESPDEEIKPGMHAEVEIATEIHKNRLLVPQDAVLVRGGRKLVFVVENGLAKWRYIEVGMENEDFAEILDGVNEGEKVITEGHFTLAHDARVRLAD